MAEEKNKSTQDTETAKVSKKEDKQEESKTFKQEDVDKIIQDRLARAEEKWHEEQKSVLEKEREEAMKLAKLTAEEREIELTKKHQAEIQQKERELNIRENRLEAIEKLSQANIPVELVDYVVDEDKDKTDEKVEKFIENYKKSIEVTVADKLKGNPPKDVNVNSAAKTEKVITAF